MQIQMRTIERDAQSIAKAASQDGAMPGSSMRGVPCTPYDEQENIQAAAVRGADILRIHFRVRSAVSEKRLTGRNCLNVNKKYL